MKFITKDITVDGVDKKQFYNIIGMEGEKEGEMVNVRQRAGEYTKEDMQEMVDQTQLRLDELKEKLATFK